jgi:hypothetical protein
MTHEDVRQELDREPFVPLRLHLASGEKLDILHPNSAFVRQNTLLVVHRLAPNTSAIGDYDVVAFRVIERITTMTGNGTRRGRGRRRAG